MITSSKQLAEYLVESGVLHSPQIINAFKSIDRADFVLEVDKDNPYGDYPLSIGYGQTISQPYTVAFMLELLEPDVGHKILDIGSGSGWTTALLSSIVGANGYVIGLEYIHELVEFGADNLLKSDIENAEIQESGKSIGIPNKNFNRILVSAAADELPKNLLKQLLPNGILVIPIKDSIFKYTKDIKGHIDVEEYYGFSFVPLV